MTNIKTKTVRPYMSEGPDITRVIVEDDGERAEIDFVVDEDGATQITDSDDIPGWVDMDAVTDAAVNH